MPHLNKPATADSQCAANEGAAKAVNETVNGGNSDKWCSLGGSNWWQVDLRTTPSVGRIVLRHAGAGGEQASVRGNTGNVSTHTFTARAARYVRVNVITPAQHGNQAARIYEAEPYTS